MTFLLLKSHKTNNSLSSLDTPNTIYSLMSEDSLRKWQIWSNHSLRIILLYWWNPLLSSLNLCLPIHSRHNALTVLLTPYIHLPKLHQFSILALSSFLDYSPTTFDIYCTILGYPIDSCLTVRLDSWTVEDRIWSKNSRLLFLLEWRSWLCHWLCKVTNRPKYCAFMSVWKGCFYRWFFISWVRESWDARSGIV